VTYIIDERSRESMIHLVEDMRSDFNGMHYDRRTNVGDCDVLLRKLKEMKKLPTVSSDNITELVG
jgi:hypothetical protein